MAKQRKQKFPSADEIIEKKNALSEKIKEKKNTISERKSPVQTFLSEIRELVEYAIKEQELTYSKLSEAIEEVYKVKISTAAISKFAVEHLGVQKAKRKKNNIEEPKESV